MLEVEPTGQRGRRRRPFRSIRQMAALSIYSVELPSARAYRFAVLQFTTSLTVTETHSHMRSHSVTCQPAEVTFPPLPQPKAGTRSSDPGGMQRWVDLSPNSTTPTSSRRSSRGCRRECRCRWMRPIADLVKKPRRYAPRYGHPSHY